MAIKGKSKSRGRARPSRAVPKPVYVPVKTPLVPAQGALDRRRDGRWRSWRSTGLVYGFVERAQRQPGERRAAADGHDDEPVSRQQVEPVLATVGSVAPPSAFTAFSDLGTAISGLRSGHGQPGRAATRPQAPGTRRRRRPKTRPTSSQAVDASQIVGGKGFSLDFVLLRAELAGRVRARRAALPGGGAAHARSPRPSRTTRQGRARGAGPAACRRSPRRSSRRPTRTTWRPRSWPGSSPRPGRSPRSAAPRARWSRSRARRDRPASARGGRGAAPPRLAARRPDVGAAAIGAARRRSVAAPNHPGFGGSEPAGDVTTMAACRRAALSGAGRGRHRSRGGLRPVDGRVRRVRALAPGPRPDRGARPREHARGRRRARGQRSARRRSRSGCARRATCSLGEPPPLPGRGRAAGARRARARADRRPARRGDRGRERSGWPSGPTPRPTSRRSTCRRS